MSRCPVFSHEELVCKMAADPDGLDLDLAKAVYDELSAIVKRETERRVHLLKVVRIYPFISQRAWRVVSLTIQAKAEVRTPVLWRMRGGRALTACQLFSQKADYK